MAEVRPDLWPLPGRGSPGSPVWESDAFAGEMRAWCSEVLDREVRLEVQKIRGWSAVWRVTDGHEVWFAKQNCPGQLFEASLLRVLSRLSDRVVPVTAVDEARGFLLTPDQGPVLTDTGGDPADLWCAVAHEGALLQREVAPYLADLEGAGVRRLGPAEATTYVATRVEQYAALPDGDLRRLDQQGADRLRAALPEVEAWADRLLALGLPLTLVHNDLHGNNVFAVDGRMRFFDFGDAVLGDPLSVLLDRGAVADVPPRVRTRRPAAGPGLRGGPRGVERPRAAGRPAVGAGRRAAAGQAGAVGVLGAMPGQPHRRRADRVRRRRDLLAAGHRGSPAADRVSRHSEGCGASTSQSILGFTPT